MCSCRNKAFQSHRLISFIGEEILFPEELIEMMANDNVPLPDGNKRVDMAIFRTLIGPLG